MKEGRKPTPTAILKMRGTYRRDRHGERGVELPASQPTRPRWLCGEGLKCWQRLCPELVRLGVLTRLDRNLLAIYCETYGQYVEALRLREQTTIMIKRADGKIVQNPIITIMAKITEQLRRLGSELGLSPAARAGLRIPAGHRAESGLSGLAKFQQRPGNTPTKS